MLLPGHTLPRIAAIMLVSSACQQGPNRESTRTDSIVATPTLARALPQQPDSTCGFVSEQHHTDAAALVKEYLRRDGAGEWLMHGATHWLATAMMCPDHRPGWDAATLVSGFDITPLTADDTSAAFEVRYSRIGPLSQDSVSFYLIEEPGIESDTFITLKTQYGWRIQTPVIHAHILPRTALDSVPRLQPRSRTRIAELIGKRAGLPN
jgi:hypothetical protein